MITLSHLWNSKMSVDKNSTLLKRADRTRLILAFNRFYQHEKSVESTERLFTFREFTDIALALGNKTSDQTIRVILKELEIPLVARIPKTVETKKAQATLGKQARRRITALETKVQELEDQLKGLTARHNHLHSHVMQYGTETNEVLRMLTEGYSKLTKQVHIANDNARTASGLAAHAQSNR